MLMQKGAGQIDEASLFRIYSDDPEASQRVSFIKKYIAEA